MKINIINKNNKKNYITLHNNLITNFSPNLLNKKDFILGQENKNKLFCKNFLLYLILIKYNKKFKFDVKTSIFIKKKSNKVYTIIRSPYRHKLARQQINFSRFFIKFVFYIKLNNIISISNFKNMVLLIRNLKKFNIIFETNIISLENTKVNVNTTFFNNFYIKNFK